MESGNKGMPSSEKGIFLSRKASDFYGVLEEIGYWNICHQTTNYAIWATYHELGINKDDGPYKTVVIYYQAYSVPTV